MLKQELQWGTGWQNTRPGEIYIMLSPSYCFELESLDAQPRLVINKDGECLVWTGSSWGARLIPSPHAWFARWRPPAAVLFPDEDDFEIPRHLRKYHGTKAQHLARFREKVKDWTD